MLLVKSLIIFGLVLLILEFGIAVGKSLMLMAFIGANPDEGKRMIEYMNELIESSNSNKLVQIRIKATLIFTGILLEEVSRERKES